MAEERHRVNKLCKHGEAAFHDGRNFLYKSIARGLSFICELEQCSSSPYCLTFCHSFVAVNLSLKPIGMKEKR